MHHAPIKADFSTPGANLLLDELTQVWELSVRSSHRFLTESDILYYKPRVRGVYLPAVEVFYYLGRHGRIAAFAGLNGGMLEMLFVRPSEQGKGYGTCLMDFVVRRRHVFKVDVNEQNGAALAFYRGRGFEVTGRDSTDPDGCPFPILHLSLREMLWKADGNMEIRQIILHKKRFLYLLLMADEQESMIDRYLERGEMFVMYMDNAPVAVSVVADEGCGVVELKNLAVAPAHRRKGYGTRLVQFLFAHYAGRFSTMTVGTGDSPLTLPFYLSLGFTPSHRVPNFFTTHYNHPIFEAGRQLIDMVYLRREL